LQAGERAGRRDAAFRIGRELRIDGIDVEILIAAGVLYVEDVLRIAAPEITADGAACFGADGTRRAEGFIGSLDPDVACALVGLQERQIAAVRRNLRAGNRHFAVK